MRNIVKPIILVCALFIGAVQAEIVFNGFASVVGGVTTSSDETLYGYDDTFDFETGSLFALQASSDLGNKLGVTVQVLSRGENDWDPDFEWAYFSYDASDNLRLLAGRQRAPFYMYSDFLDVSYAYHWISPPPGVYSLAFDTFDGVAAIYSGQIGSFDSVFHFSYGGNDDEITLLGETTNPEFNDFVGASLTLTKNWLTLRAGYFQAEVNIPVAAIQPLISGWQQAGFSDIADEIELAKDTGEFYEFGFQIDYEDFLIVGEYTDLILDEMALGDQESFYIMAGKRFNEFLLHFTYGEDSNTQDNYVAHIPKGLDPALDFLIASTEAVIESQKVEQSYFTLGLRWDFHDSAALKFEYTDFSDDLDGANDAGLFRAAIVSVF